MSCPENAHAKETKRPMWSTSIAVYSISMTKFVSAIGVEFSSYAYEAKFIILAQDNVVKNFTDFGLEWEIQFTVTILNDISSGLHNIMYIPGTYMTLSFEMYFV